MSLALTLYNAATPWLPNRGFFALRRALLRTAGIEVGRDVRIAGGARFYGENIRVGANSWIGPEASIIGTASGPVSIGANVDLGPGVLVTSGTHQVGTSQHRAGAAASAPVAIGNGTWVGARSVILAGARIGDGCVVAGGSVVTAGDYRTDALLAGVPARMVKTYHAD